MKAKRVFLIVLDSVGAGEAPDAAAFGDFGVNTIRSVSRSPYFCMDHLRQMGYGNIDGLDFLGKTDTPTAATARMREASAGKDTTIGHWEIAGLFSPTPLPTYPNGFPDRILDAFCAATGRGILCNRPYSGTRVIQDYGEEHLRTGKLIVYTSADSVFQIAAHEDLVPPAQLYEYCRMARKLLCGADRVGRVIARPFAGAAPDFYRTANRHDFSLEPPGDTINDILKAAGRDVIAVGKIYDIFAGRGFTDHMFTHSNQEGMAVTKQPAERDFSGLCFVNLVDFDMLYGHRRDVDGYARALAAFDAWLPGFLSVLHDEDVLMITADHGCDPAYTATTDHTREYTPLLLYGRQIMPDSFGTRNTFADIGATVLSLLGVDGKTTGTPLPLRERKERVCK